MWSGIILRKKKGKGDRQFSKPRSKEQSDAKYQKGKEAKDHLFKNRNQERIEIKDKKNPLNRSSNGRFQINVVAGDEHEEEWFDIAQIPEAQHVNVPVDQDGDDDFEMKLGQ